MVYRHVDMLNEAGIPAFVLHERPGFSCLWFEHDTPLRAVPQVRLTPQDLLVVPEVYGPTLSALPSTLRIVVLNQNAYNTFDGLSHSSSMRGGPYRELAGLEAIMVVSHDNLEYLRFGFPDLLIERIPCGIDAAVFHPGTQRPGRRIAVMPRKRVRDLNQVLHLLNVHGTPAGWEIVQIDNRSERETADLLRSCALFLCLSEREGFGLPPVEAMACGCYVTGFTGLAGREFFRPEFSSPVDEGDVLALARSAVTLMREYESRPLELRGAGLAASRFVLETYSLERQRVELVQFFTGLLHGERTDMTGRAD
jgi:Glycosyl transferases group 1